MSSRTQTLATSFDDALRLASNAVTKLEKKSGPDPEAFDAADGLERLDILLAQGDAAKQAAQAQLRSVLDFLNGHNAGTPSRLEEMPAVGTAARIYRKAPTNFMSNL